MTCPECHRMMPDDSGCPWCVSADVARNPTVPRALRLAPDPRESPRKALQGPEASTTAPAPPEGLTEARRELAAAIDRKTKEKP